MSDIDQQSEDYRRAVDQFAQRIAGLYTPPFQPDDPPPPGVLAAIDEFDAALRDAPHVEKDAA